jgi:hypothetical protein
MTADWITRENIEWAARLTELHRSETMKIPTGTQMR